MTNISSYLLLHLLREINHLEFYCKHNSQPRKDQFSYQWDTVMDVFVGFRNNNLGTLGT